MMEPADSNNFGFVPSTLVSPNNPLAQHNYSFQEASQYLPKNMENLSLTENSFANDEKNVSKFSNITTSLPGPPPIRSILQGHQIQKNGMFSNQYQPIDQNFENRANLSFGQLLQNKNSSIEATNNMENNQGYINPEYNQHSQDMVPPHESVSQPHWDSRSQQSNISNEGANYSSQAYQHNQQANISTAGMTDKNVWQSQAPQPPHQTAPFFQPGTQPSSAPLVRPPQAFHPPGGYVEPPFQPSGSFTRPIGAVNSAPMPPRPRAAQGMVPPPQFSIPRPPAMPTAPISAFPRPPIGLQQEPLGGSHMSPVAGGVGGFVPASRSPPQMMPSPPGGHFPSQGPPSSIAGPGFAAMPPGGQPRLPPPPAMTAPSAVNNQRRLSPDIMPSAVEVQEMDAAKRSGLFDPNEADKCPPLVTTDFHCQEIGGNCSPRYIRSSLYNVPITADLMKQLSLSLNLVVVPFAGRHPREQAIPVSDCGPAGPMRCTRCKAYMSPFMTFIDGGRRFQCALCSAMTEVSDEYFAHLDHTGRRMDCYQRPELCLGSYELTATAAYCRKDVLPNPPAFIFALDVSFSSVRNGLIQLVCDQLKSQVLSVLPRDEGSEQPIRVGFITYDRVIHFYNLNPSLSHPQIQVVSDVADVFVPLVNGFLVNVDDGSVSTLIDGFLDMLRQQYLGRGNNEAGDAHQNAVRETCLGPVIQAALEAFKASNMVGKIFIMHGNLPTAEAPGKLKNRDDRKVIGTDKEKTLFNASTNYYSELGQACVKEGCSVDLFLFPSGFVDVASICQVARYTAGNVFKYTDFQAASHQGQQFMSDLRRSVTGLQGFDAVTRVRTSAGVRPVNFYGNFFMACSTDIDVAAVDQRTCINTEIKHDDKLREADFVYIQAATLYTTIGGQRRIRVHNLRLLTSAQKLDIFKAIDLDTVMNSVAKEMMLALAGGSGGIIGGVGGGGGGGKTSKDVRAQIAARCAQILAAYRLHCAANNEPGELVLPEQMKLFPLYCNSLANSDAVNSDICQAFMPQHASNANEISTDDRCQLMFLVNSMPVNETNLYIYPRLFRIDNFKEDELKSFPKLIRCSFERLDPEGVYILENGILLFIWLGEKISGDWVQKVFGVPSANALTSEHFHKPAYDNDFSRRFFAVLEEVRGQRPSRSLKTVVVRQKEVLMENWFRRFMVEDQNDSHGASYVDYLCHIHKEVRSLLSA